ncbi:MAG: M23 family metallopeptidase [Cyanobacteria bacterium P01_D01_bin.1]
MVNLLSVTTSPSAQPFSRHPVKSPPESSVRTSVQPSVDSSTGPSGGQPVDLPIQPKRPCRVTVTEPGWQGARTAAIAAGCSSVSDMLEKLGRGELAIIASDAMQLDPVSTTPIRQASHPVPQYVHYHVLPHETSRNRLGDLDSEAEDSEAEASEAKNSEAGDDTEAPLVLSLLKLIVTGACATVLIGSLLYIADRIITVTSGVFDDREQTYLENTDTPLTGDIVAGYTVSDEYGIRAFHPVTGEPNVPHNGVDLAMDIGTPIHAVGKAGDTVTVECWWDVDGGGWVVDQTAQSYPGYTFQSLHMSENGCRQGKAEAGEVIAYSGNSGIGTGAHYDFRVKIDGSYVPPATLYLESAVTGEPPEE